MLKCPYSGPIPKERFQRARELMRPSHSYHSDRDLTATETYKRAMECHTPRQDHGRRMAALAEKGKQHAVCNHPGQNTPAQSFATERSFPTVCGTVRLSMRADYSGQLSQCKLIFFPSSLSMQCCYFGGSGFLKPRVTLSAHSPSFKKVHCISLLAAFDGRWPIFFSTTFSRDLQNGFFDYGFKTKGKRQQFAVLSLD